ncbi:LysE family translocator [Pseudocolwellia agarivorans]|uniref:LysE family translocator n=1 Tax=Pseudocolwellia agarivorans TaxID=1911682 RepID=UPI00098554CA|nr:LysE family translocator [Pseudocolwellia agarivorans]
MEIFSLAIIGFLIVISPGADFVLVLKNSINSGRKAGILTACGISLAIGVHIAYSMLGISYLISQNLMLFTFIKYAGATYLVYIGVKSILTANDKMDEIGSNSSTNKSTRYFVQGFFCNMLNPKTMLFFISLFSQLISADSSNNYALAYGLYIAILHGLWFSLVSIMFTSKPLQNKLIHMKKWINKACGVGLVSFGIILAAKS